MLEFKLGCYKTRGSWSMKVDVTCGMIRTSTEFVLMACWEDVYPQPKEWESLRNVMRHHMGGIMVYTVLRPRSGKADSFGQPCTRTPKTSSGNAEVASTMEESLQEMQCPTEQPPSRIIWRLGHWLHGTIPKVLWQRIHPGGSRLCVKMGRSNALPCCWCQACSKDVPRGHLSSFWNTKDGDKWRRVSLHW